HRRSLRSFPTRRSSDLAPPLAGTPQAAEEITEIVQLQRSRTAATDSMIRRWSGLPTSPWHALALDRLEVYWVLLPDVRSATPARDRKSTRLNSSHDQIS